MKADCVFGNLNQLARRDLEWHKRFAPENEDGPDNVDRLFHVNRTRRGLQNC
jgi:hypothetical protein